MMAIKHSSFGKPILPDRKFAKPTDGYETMPEGADREAATERMKNLIADDLTAEEIDEFNATINHLNAVANSDTGRFPGHADVKAFINSRSPGVRHWLNVMADYIREPRQLPFEYKRSEAENCDRCGLDPDTAALVIAAMDGVDVRDGLHGKMIRNDSYKPRIKGPEGPSLREMTSAALDAETPGIIRQVEADAYSDNAAEGLTLRQTLKTLLDTTEDMDGERYEPAKRR